MTDSGSKELAENLIEVATRTKNCLVCGDKGNLCADCLESFKIVDKMYKEEISGLVSQAVEEGRQHERINQALEGDSSDNLVRLQP